MWPGELVKDRLLVSVGHLVAAYEQGGHRHAQEGGDLQQSAAADAIGSLLVFLDLLERQFELIGKLGLSKPLLQTINPDIAANDLVDSVGPFASHKPSSFLTTKIYRTVFRCKITGWTCHGSGLQEIAPVLWREVPGLGRRLVAARYQDTGIFWSFCRSVGGTRDAPPQV